MGRPRRGEEKNAPHHLGFRVPEWVRAGLGQLAAQRDCPVSEIRLNQALGSSYSKRNGSSPASRASAGELWHRGVSPRWYGSAGELPAGRRPMSAPPWGADVSCEW